MSEREHLRAALVSCIECGHVGGLVKGWVLRRHLSAAVPPMRPRADRICPSSGTGNWKSPEHSTRDLALLAWGEDGPPGVTDMSEAERAHYLERLAEARSRA